MNAYIYDVLYIYTYKTSLMFIQTILGIPLLVCLFYQSSNSFPLMYIVFRMYDHNHYIQCNNILSFCHMRALNWSINELKLKLRSICEGRAKSMHLFYNTCNTERLTQLCRCISPLRNSPSSAASSTLAHPSSSPDWIR
jgi:hypothetical protein